MKIEKQESRLFDLENKLEKAMNKLSEVEEEYL